MFTGIKLYRIEALKDFSNVTKGDKGGWIEKFETLDEVEDYFYSQYVEEDKSHAVLLNTWNEETKRFDSETVFTGDSQNCYNKVSNINEISSNQYIEIIEQDENGCIENSWVKLKGDNIDEIAEENDLEIKYS